MTCAHFIFRRLNAARGISVIELSLYLMVAAFVGLIGMRAILAGTHAQYMVNNEEEQHRAYDALRAPVGDLREADAPFMSWPTGPGTVPWFKEDARFICFTFEPRGDGSSGDLVKIESAVVNAGDYGSCSRTAGNPSSPPKATILISNVIAPTSVRPIFQKDPDYNTLTIRVLLQSLIRTDRDNAINKPIEVVRVATPRL